MVNLLINTLKKKGYRVTQSRIKIIDCLLDGKPSHTIEEIQRHIKKRINVKSIYSTLTLLIEEDLVHEYIIKGKRIFEVVAGVEDQIKLFDEQQNLVKRIKVTSQIKESLTNLVKNSGYCVNDFKIEVHCKKCQK